MAGVNKVHELLGSSISKIDLQPAQITATFVFPNSSRSAEISIVVSAWDLNLHLFYEKPLKNHPRNQRYHTKPE